MQKNLSNKSEIEIKNIEESLLQITYPICKFGQVHFQENATQICLDERCAASIRFEAICNICTSKKGEHFQDQHRHANLGAITQDLIDQIKEMILPKDVNKVSQAQQVVNTINNASAQPVQEEKGNVSEDQKNIWLDMAEQCQQVARKIHISIENYKQSKFGTVPTECLQILSCISNLTKLSTIDNINQQFRELQRYTKIQLPATNRDSIALKIEDSEYNKILGSIEKKTQEQLRSSQQIQKEIGQKVEDLAKMPEIQGYAQIKYQEYQQENVRAFQDKCILIEGVEDVSRIQPNHELITVIKIDQEVFKALGQIDLSNRLLDIESYSKAQTANCKNIIEFLESDIPSLQNLSGINLNLQQQNIRDINSTNDSSNDLIAQVLRPIQKLIQQNKIKDIGFNFKDWSKCTDQSANLLSDTFKLLVPSANNLISFSLNLQSLFHLGGDSFGQLIDTLKQLALSTTRLQNFSLNMSRLVNLQYRENKAILEFLELVVLNNKNLHLFDIDLALTQNLNEEYYKHVAEIMKILATNNKTISILKLSFRGWQDISAKNALIILDNIENVVMSNNLIKTFALDMDNWGKCTDQCVYKVDYIIKTIISFCKNLEEIHLNMGDWQLATNKAASTLASTLVKLAQVSTRITSFSTTFQNWQNGTEKIFKKLQQDVFEILFSSESEHND